jgi:hypothetical protein
MANILENYNSVYKNNEKDFIFCYKDLVEEYLNSVQEFIKKNGDTQDDFILKRGIDTLTHCFKLLLIYSKNIEVVTTNCKKAICYYIEFIGQIGEDSNSFLQLSSKDATLFVYKKILFTIDRDFRKTHTLTTDEKIYGENIILHIEIYKNLFMNGITSCDDYDASIKKSKTILSSLVKKRFKNISLELLKSINHALLYVIKDPVNYLNIVNGVIKKLHKNKERITIDSLNSKLLEYKNLDFDEAQHTKFVSWMFS